MTVLLESWFDRLPWQKAAGVLTATEILRGSDKTKLAVIPAQSSDGVPAKADLEALWKARAGHGVEPVLVAALYEAEGRTLVALLGPDRDAVPVMGVEQPLAERLIEHALKIDTQIGLVSELRRRLHVLKSGVGPGFRNEGLFATHVLVQQPNRADWTSLCQRSKPLISQQGQPLLKSLGYSIDQVRYGVVLREATTGTRHAAAILLTDEESFDNPLSRFHGSTAVTHGLAVAKREGVPWLIVLGGAVARLYPVNPDLGVGRKGQTQTFAEVDLDLLTDATAGYLALLFSPEALTADGIVWQLLADSGKYATSLSERLRDRIYADVIPVLAVEVAEQMRVMDLPAAEQKAALDEAYHRAMIILFRLLFVAYAEDRGLLPLDVNATYTANALKTLARRILDEGDEAKFSDASTSMWDDLRQIWKVIDKGDLETTGVPAYNGGLFTNDATKNPSGAATYTLELPNSCIGRVIRGLMIDDTADDVLGMVDFRSLDVREFGTIYEGLLESGLGIASDNLTVDGNDTFVPAKQGDQVLVEAGRAYFHSRSGSRKATGSYFTKPFAVQHLLDQALEPAITQHLERVKTLMASGATVRAADALFDFRVADLSMGSAHFLVAAIDRIEARFSEFLAIEKLPEVAVELQHLRAVAAQQLGIAPEDSNIDDGMLLRRQIARRCIYGIDINEIAVELARLAVWIHTFVPGLPLSFLNHGLVWGNSLTGVGTLDEIVQAIEAAQERENKASDRARDGLFSLRDVLEDFLTRSGKYLDQLASLSDASIADVAEAARIQGEIRKSLEPLEALCDLITAERTTRHLKNADPDKIWLVKGSALGVSLDADELESAIMKHRSLARAREAAKSVQAGHMPVAFPEVFRRSPAGFDVILGNPPWEKLHVEEHIWWGARFPGLRSLTQHDKLAAITKYRTERPDLCEEYEREVSATRDAACIVSAGPFPGIGEAHLDLFAAFCWRFWHEVRNGGHIGVVLPRTAVSGAATTHWRATVLTEGSIPDLTSLTNTGRWAFDMEPRYTVVLMTMSKTAGTRGVSLRGPYSSLAEYQSGMAAGKGAVATVPAEVVRGWSSTASIPLIPAEDVSLFGALRRHPAFDCELLTWRFRPVQGDVNAAKEKKFYDFNLDAPAVTNTLPILTGSSCNIWDPSYGSPYAYADPQAIMAHLNAKRANQIKLKSSAFYGLGEEWAKDSATLPMARPRIAFRDVCRANDSRTMICALVPGGVALVHKAPYLFRQTGSDRDTAYLLGILSSIPFDWFTRRFVELSMSFELLNSFPVPRVASDGSVVGEAGALDVRDHRHIRDRVIHVSGRLAAVDDRYADWAAEVGVPVGSAKTQEEKDDLIAELDALVSLLYGLSADQVRQVFATFHRGWDFRPRLQRVLAHYERWAETIV